MTQNFTLNGTIVCFMDCEVPYNVYILVTVSAINKSSKVTALYISQDFLLLPKPKVKPRPSLFLVTLEVKDNNNGRILQKTETYRQICHTKGSKMAYIQQSKTHSTKSTRDH